MSGAFMTITRGHSTRARAMLPPGRHPTRKELPNRGAEAHSAAEAHGAADAHGAAEAHVAAKEARHHRGTRSRLSHETNKRRHA